MRNNSSCFAQFLECDKFQIQNTFEATDVS